MLNNPTTVHISLVTAISAFSVSALSLILGYFLIVQGTTGSVSLQLATPTFTVNFYAFVPGVAFGLFGATIAWRALSVLITRS